MRGTSSLLSCISQVIELFSLYVLHFYHRIYLNEDLSIFCYLSLLTFILNLRLDSCVKHEFSQP